MLDEIKKAVQHECIHNDGMMISVTLKEMIWLMQQAEKVAELETLAIDLGKEIERFRLRNEELLTEKERLKK